MEQPKDDVPFEQAFQQLEQLVKNMESDRLPLDQLVEHYERGNRLLKTCQKRIQEAEKRIEQIASGKTGGLEPFDPPASTPASPNSGEQPVRRAARKPGPPSGDSSEEIQLF
ncbi:MAG: exodeoxyribonuclease VII small subunit [Verrucomicrobia bacterium]|nr:exodeoxyribonuclease VII small subunit [Verrucomicrobiota bacterium]